MDDTSRKLRRSALERKAFTTGLVLKLIDGCVELGCAAVVWFVSPSTVDQIARFVTDFVLSNDDVLADYVVGAAHHFASTGSRLFVTAYLLAHGLVKVVMVIALFRGRRWAYPALIISLGLFIVYQGYRMIVRPSWGLAALTLFDVVIVWLVAREYRRRRTGVIS